MKGVVLFQLALIVAFIYGWIVNLIDVINAATAGSPFTTMLILRIIGIPFGLLGAILGWF
ncbi:hypothetical protein NKH91_05995 [Mesorhizobium sp. M0894]|uniref:hypothetical protein n=1 Tax=unclassified Mesorhizobium TaxID=325217 RepID=UPI00333AD08C